MGNKHSFFHLEDGSMGNLQVGDEVNRGQKIGSIGTTGTSTAPHLHYEVRNSRGAVTNPRNSNPQLTNAPTTKIVRARMENIKALQNQRQQKIMRTPSHSTIL